MIRRLIIALAVALTLSAVLSAQSADEVIAKALEALGGKDKLEAIQSSKASGRIIVQGGLASGALTIYQMQPNKLRQDININGVEITQAYDGEDAWKIFPVAAGGKGVPEPMTEQEKEAMQLEAELQGLFLDYKEKGHEVELVGTEDMEGTQVNHLKITLNNGKIIHQYLDVDTGLNLKSVTMQFVPQAGREMEAQTFLSDYKEVEGVYLPHAIETKFEGQTAAQIVFEEFELNPDLDPALFSRSEGDSQ